MLQMSTDERAGSGFTGRQTSTFMPGTMAVIHGSPLTRLGISVVLQGYFPFRTLSYLGDSFPSAHLALADTDQALVVIDANLGSPAHNLDAVSSFVTSGASVVALCSPGFAPALTSLLDAGANSLVSTHSSTQDFEKACDEALAGNIWFSMDLVDGLIQGSPRIELSAQQRRALVLYTSGLTMDAVGRRMGISTNTAKDYIDRVRAKYVKTGVTPRTKTELYVAAKQDGLIA